MNTNQALAQAKKSARALTKALGRQGLALSLGQALEVQAQVAGFADWNAYSTVVGTTTAEPVSFGVTHNRRVRKQPACAQLLITDVDFMKVHAIIFDGVSHSVGWREEEALRYLGKQAAPEYDDWEDQTALLLHYENDGFIEERTLTVGELNGLTWDSLAEVFKDSDGNTFELHVSSKFGAEGGAAPRKKTQGALSVSRKSEKALESYRLFQLTLTTTSRFNIAAVDVESARVEATKQLYLQPGAPCDVQELDESEFGPYMVEANGGFYNEFESLNQAIRVAKGLLAADDSLDSVRVVSALGAVFVSFDA